MTISAKKYRLGDLVSFVSGGTPSKQVPAYWGGETPWVSAKDLKSLRIATSIDTLSDEGRQVASMVPSGTLLILVRGMSLFKSIPLGVTTRELAINQDLKGLIPNGKASAEFLAYNLLARESSLLQMVESAGHGTGRLDTDVLKDFMLRIPQKDEQDRIVRTIATWDAAIEKTEQLIAAKERSQRGWMQKLVMDRLFPEHRLSEFVHRVNRKNSTGNGHPLTISGRDGLISQSHYFEKRIAAETTEHYTLLKRGRVLLQQELFGGLSLRRNQTSRCIWRRHRFYPLLMLCAKPGRRPIEQYQFLACVAQDCDDS